jgi:hypothetical protein
MQDWLHSIGSFCLTTDKSAGSVPDMERGVLAVGPGARIGELQARAFELADRYEDLAATARAAAVRWRWATPTSGLGDVEPLRLERLGCSPGRLLAGPPPAGSEREAIGYDALERVVCVREYDETGAVWLERFATWSAEAVEVACFRAPLDWGAERFPATLQSLLRMRLAGGLPAESERLMPPTGACFHDRYRHRDGRLVRVEEEAGDDTGARAVVVKEVVYDEEGRVVGIDRLGPDGREPVWRRPGSPHRSGARVRLPRQVCA